MLSAILKKSDCASCKFCCSFRRQSLWETPIFSKEIAEQLKDAFPNAKFRRVGKSSMTIDLEKLYKTNNPEEEVPCPFLDSKKGCCLPPDLKPFDCSIWPFRAVRVNEDTVSVALTPTCPSINKVPRQKIMELLEAGLREKILKFAELNPDIIKENSKFFLVLQ
jgi:Fe-S-cluster containining protein